MIGDAALDLAQQRVHAQIDARCALELAVVRRAGERLRRSLGQRFRRLAESLKEVIE